MRIIIGKEYITEETRDIEFQILRNNPQISECIQSRKMEIYKASMVGNNIVLRVDKGFRARE
jgi:hypothetical protein